jgi:hypothetical protein
MFCPEEYGEVGEVGVTKHIGNILGADIVVGEYLVCHLKAKGLHPAVW